MIAFISFSIIFVFCAVCLALEIWKFYINQTKLKNLIVCKAPPIVGNLIDLLECDAVQIIDFPNRMMEQYQLASDTKGVFGWIIHMLFMYTDHPDTYEIILNSDKALKKAYLYGFLRNSEGIFTSEPNKWKSHRRVLNSTLGPKMVKSFIPIFNEKYKKMVDLMDRQVDEPVDMHLIMFKSTIDVVFQSSFDVNWSMQNHCGEQLRDLIVNLFERVQLRVHSIWMKPDILYKRTNFNQLDDEAYPRFHRLVNSVLEVKKLDLAEKLVNGIDELAIVKETNSANFLQKCLLMEMENKFDDRDICEEMQTVLIGSIDTTSLTINGIILLLAIHQEYQDRVLEELHSIFTDPNEPVTHDHLQQMTFLELVIKEGSRHFPVAPYLGREATDDIPIPGGIIPKGTTIILNIYKSNRNPTYWGENAKEFYPERFLPENCINHHPYQYIPFSAGSRNW